MTLSPFQCLSFFHWHLQRMISVSEKLCCIPSGVGGWTISIVPRVLSPEHPSCFLASILPSFRLWLPLPVTAGWFQGTRLEPGFLPGAASLL